MVSCLLFDLDGTLFDSREANIAAYSLAFGEAGLEFDVEKYQASFGLRFSEMMREVAPGSSPETHEIVRTKKALHYKQNLSLVRPNQGLLSLAEAARGKFKTALVTTASKQNVMNLLSHFSIQPDLFDAIITGEDVKHGKPNPECYLTAMKSLDAEPAECCIFEDSLVGVEAARKSGAQVIKVQL